jgi:large subunit ribosomal protein L22
MEIKAQHNFTRTAPRKLRLVANTVRKMPLEQAIKQLAVIERRSTMPILKVVKQAVANAVNNHRLAYEDLELVNIRITEGPRYKRFRAVSRGRAHEVKKRTSHITVTLRTREAEMAQKSTKETKEKAVAKASPAKK